MFTKPKYGWTNLKLDKYSLRASYLTDVPFDCLDSFIYGIKNNKPICIYFDAEGWDYYLVSNWYNSWIILNKEETELCPIKENIRQLGKMLAENIELYFNEWLEWDYFDDEVERNDRRIVLTTKLKILKSLLEMR